MRPLSRSLLILGVAAFILLVACTDDERAPAPPPSGRPSEASTASAPENPAAPGGERIDPETYRAEIEELEALLYRPEPMRYGEESGVEDALRRMGARVMNSTADPIAHQKGSELVALAGRVARESKSGKPLPDRARMRLQWEKVRTRVFQDADWFRRSL
jgi:hypothetical protein